MTPPPAGSACCLGPILVSHRIFVPESIIRQVLTAEREKGMGEYIPPAIDWVREQVELYEGSGGTEGTTLRDTGLPCIIVTNVGRKTGAIRKTPLMTVKAGGGYVLIGSYGGHPKDPVWIHNLRANPDVEIRDGTEVFKLRVREVTEDPERAQLWDAAVAAFPNYVEYQAKAPRIIPVFIAEPV
jgi:deazaflavin-dependent oxidoreductase (nitroreductase family)